MDNPLIWQNMIGNHDQESIGKLDKILDDGTYVFKLNPYGKSMLEQLKKENMDTQLPTRIDKRICKANEVASHDTENFEKLTEFANQHPIIFMTILYEFLVRPDARFGDTLLVFCDCVRHGTIRLSWSLDGPSK